MNPTSRTRRRVLESILWSTAGAALSACGGGASGGDDTPPPPLGAPNVLMISVDDLNDWVGFLGGHPQVLTPNMDRLARQSTIFRRAYCNAPYCNPSRASAMSGLTVQQTKVFDNNTSIESVTPSAVNFPDHLRANGYESELLGKIYHVSSSPNPPRIPPTVPATNQACFDIARGHPEAWFDWAPLDINDADTGDGLTADAAIEFLHAPRRKPFFLGVGLQRTHLAWYVPRKYFELYDDAFNDGSLYIPEGPADDLNDLPPRGRAIALLFGFHKCITDQNLWRSAVRGYLASISFVDAQLGRVLDALEASPHAANTVVVMWGDHGYHLGEKFAWHKQALWERATRIPFTIRAPGQSERRFVDAPVSLLDLMPTVLDFAQVDPPYALSGRSLRPLTADPALPWDHPVLTTRGQHDHAIRTSRWRYIRYENRDPSLRHRELYDTIVDPNELVNLADDPANAAVMSDLDALMPPPPA